MALRNRVPLTKARADLDTLINRFRRNKGHFILEKYGVPVAALLDLDEYEDYLDSQCPRLKEQIRAGHAEYACGTLTEDFDAFLCRIKSKPGNRRAK